MQNEEQLLAHMRKLIEEKLGWGDSKTWTNQDFTRLSDEILEATGVNLSPSTLKRIWGKVRYDSVPHTTTLDALAVFLGYDSWRTFRINVAKAPEPESASLNSQEMADTGTSPPGFRKFTIRMPSGVIESVGLVTVVVMALVLAFSLHVKDEEAALIDSAAYSFSSHSTARGLPNSVIFTYDASRAPSDCVYVQQSWGSNRRFKVSKAGKQVTSLYYYPGYFQAKLLVNNQVVKEHPLLIPTQGWLPLVEQDPVPVYFRPAEALNKGMLALTAKQLQANHYSASTGCA